MCSECCSTSMCCECCRIFMCCVSLCVYCVIVEGPLVHVLCWVVEMMVFRVSTD